MVNGVYLGYAMCSMLVWVLMLGSVVVWICIMLGGYIVVGVGTVSLVCTASVNWCRSWCVVLSRCECMSVGLVL